MILYSMQPGGPKSVQCLNLISSNIGHYFGPPGTFPPVL
jgi:hypothetical protein